MVKNVFHTYFVNCNCGVKYRYSEKGSTLKREEFAPRSKLIPCRVDTFQKGCNISSYSVISPKRKSVSFPRNVSNILHFFLLSGLNSVLIRRFFIQFSKLCYRHQMKLFSRYQRWLDICQERLKEMT